MVAWLIFGTIALMGAAFAAAPLVRTRRARVAAFLILIPVVGAGLGLYAFVGRPDLAARTFEVPEEQQLNALVAELSVKARERPNELQGWLLLGRGYFALGDPADAAKALAEAVRVANAKRLPDGERAAILSDYGVALSQASQAVTADAETAFTQAVAANPKDMAARYYLGIAAAQRGDFDGAESIWQVLLADAPADAPYRGEVVDRLAALRAQQAARGGTAPDVQAMVEGLAARLQQNPKDLEGWQRLMRAYTVLGEREKAAEALRRARATFAGNAAALAALARAAYDNKLE